MSLIIIIIIIIIDVVCLSGGTLGDIGGVRRVTGDSKNKTGLVSRHVRCVDTRVDDLPTRSSSSCRNQFT